MVSSNTFNLSSSTSQQLLSLDTIRSVLQRLEDTIVFQLIERAQFARNDPMYKAGAFKELKEKENWDGSWVEWFLKETESAHAKCRRWEAPDEYPFTSPSLLPPPILPPVSYPPLLYPHKSGDHGINVNSQIFEFYRDTVIPSIAKEGDDGNYGSAAVRDVEVLSALSRRIHFGMFVSESKFLSSPSSFLEPIRTKNREVLESLITKPEVEAKLLIRLAEKAKVYGQDLDKTFALMQGANKDGLGEMKSKIEVEEVVRLYKSFVIPLTKVVEVDYLIGRLDGLSEEEVQKLCATD